MDLMQALAWVIFAGSIAVVLLVVALLVMAVMAAAGRVRAPAYHRMSPEERRAWRAAHHHETGDVRHA